MSRGFDIYIESGREALRKLGDWRKVAGEVKSVVLRHWPRARVYVFGSTPKGRYTAASDIDILVVLEDEPSPDEVAVVKAHVIREVDAPVELHVASRRQLDRWYRRFIDELVEV